MSNERDDRETGPDDEGDAPTPFDHPLFFPAVLFAALVWFGYDGWLNPEYQPGGSKHESLGFSQWGAAALLVALVYSSFRGLQELREKGESGEADPHDRRD